MKAKAKKVETAVKPVDLDMIKLGKRMKELRKKKGHTSAEIFAYDCNVTRVLYSGYERGKGNATWKNIMKIIRGLDVTVAEFFSEGFD